MSLILQVRDGRIEGQASVVDNLARYGGDGLASGDLILELLRIKALIAEALKLGKEVIIQVSKFVFHHITPSSSAS